MADVCDDADIASAFFFANALVKSRKGTFILDRTGFCHNCGELIKGGIFCDTDCQDDHAKRQRILEAQRA